MSSFAISVIVDKIVLQANKDRDLRFMLLQDLFQQLNKIATNNHENGEEKANTVQLQQPKNLRSATKTFTQITISTFPAETPAFDLTTERRIYRLLLYFYLTGQPDISEVCLQCILTLMIVSRVPTLLEIITEILTHRMSPADIQLQFPPATNARTNYISNLQMGHDDADDDDMEAVTEGPEEATRKREARAQSAIIAIFSAIASFDAIVPIADEVIPYIIKSTIAYNDKLSGRHDNNLAFSIDMVAILASLIQAKASLLFLHFASLVEFLLRLLLFSTSPILVNAVSSCMALLAPHLSSSLKDSIVSTLLSDSTSKNSAAREVQYFAKFSLIESVSAACPSFFASSMPQILNFIKSYLIILPSSELRQHEFGFLALDAIIKHSLPTCLPLLPQIIPNCVQPSIAYDPNFVGFDNHDDADVIEGDDYEQADEDIVEDQGEDVQYEQDEYVNDEEYGEDLDVEDNSWRIRRAVLKMILTMFASIISYSENVILKEKTNAGSQESSHFINQLLIQLLPILVSRCNERVNHVGAIVYANISKILHLSKIFNSQISTSAPVIHAILPILKKRSLKASPGACTSEEAQILQNYFIAFSTAIEVLPTPTHEVILAIAQYSVGIQKAIFAYGSTDVSLAFCQYYISLWRHYPSNYWLPYLHTFGDFIVSLFADESTPITLLPFEAFDAYCDMLHTLLPNQPEDEDPSVMETFINSQLDNANQYLMPKLAEESIQQPKAIEPAFRIVFEKLLSFLNSANNDRAILQRTLTSLSNLLHKFGPILFTENDFLSCSFLISRYISHSATRSQAVLCAIRLLQTKATTMKRAFLGNTEHVPIIFDAILSNLLQSDRLLQHRSLLALYLFSSTLISNFATDRSIRKTSELWINVSSNVTTIANSIVNSFANFAIIFTHSGEWLEEIKAILLVFPRLIYIPLSIQETRDYCISELHSRILHPLIALPTLISVHMDVLICELHSISFALFHNFDVAHAQMILNQLQFPTSTEITLWLSTSYSRAAVSTGNYSSIFYVDLETSGVQSNAMKADERTSQNKGTDELLIGSTLAETTKSSLEFIAGLHLSYPSSVHIPGVFQRIATHSATQLHRDDAAVPVHQVFDRLLACALAILIKEYPRECLPLFFQLLSILSSTNSELLQLLNAFDIALENILLTSKMTKGTSLKSNTKNYTFLAPITKPNNEDIEIIFESLDHCYKELIRLLPNGASSLQQLIYTIFTKIWTIFPFWKPAVDEKLNPELFTAYLTAKKEILTLYSSSKPFRGCIENTQILGTFGTALLHDRDQILSLLTSSSLIISIASLQFISALSEFPDILILFVSSSRLLHLLLTLLTTKRKEHVKMVAFGPIQKRVDEGIEMRSQAWQTICDIMTAASFNQLVSDSSAEAPTQNEMNEGAQQVDATMLVEAIQYGLQDEYDVRILVLERLPLFIKWLPIQPLSVISLGAALVACQATTTISGGGQMEDMRQEVEGVENLTLTVAKTSHSLVTCIQQGTNFRLADVEQILNSSPFVELERLNHSNRNPGK